MITDFEVPAALNGSLWAPGGHGALVSGGATNAEVGATMFISSNAVEYHLRKILQEFGISSRRQFADKLAKSKH